MQNDRPAPFAAALPSGEDPRLRALAEAMRASAVPDDVLSEAVRDGLLAGIGARLQPGAGATDAQLPPDWPGPAQAVRSLAALEDLELACLSHLLRHGRLESETLSAVHAEFARARARASGDAGADALQRALAARDRQLSMATHELRTPISSILLNVQMLERAARRQDPLDAATVTRMLAVPTRQLRRLTRMVDLLLDAARVENERLVLEPQQVDLCELVHDAAARLQDLASTAGCEISLAGCVPVVGHWDRMRLEQVVTNLFTNAIKYGGGRVEVGTRGGSEAVITVRDHGGGIAAEDQPRIFEPFERLASTSGEDGAGLGLYIVREIVRAHGGRIEVASTPGDGAMFSVFLPL